MKAILIIFTLIFLKIVVAEPNIVGVLNNYLEVKDALVNGESKTASGHATELLETISASAWFSEKEDMSKAVKNFLKAKDLESQRNAFAKLSIIVWKSVKNSDSLKYSVYYQYCPMKNAYWISKEETIKNPYYGSAMLTCGNISDKKIR